MGAMLGRTFTDYRTFVDICRARADEMGLSRAEIDRLSGLPAGYSGKLLGKASVDDVGCPQKKTTKKMYPAALDCMLGVLGLKILLIEDNATAARTLALREPVDRANQRFENVCRISAKLLPKPSPPTLTVVPNKRAARGGKYG
jgi:hypothetical protein